MIPIKSEKDLQILRAAGKILSGITREVLGAVKPGISTKEIDHLAEELMLKESALPAFKGYKGFPATVCTSVNEEIVHGIPGARKIREGDILSLDIGINYQGYFSDTAVTLIIAKVPQEVRKLVEVTKDALFEGINKARVGNYLSDISWAIQNYVEKNGFSVVRQFVGHGIGDKLHEEPEIPNFGRPGTGPVLKAGMVLAIEPMVNMGTWEAMILDNGWTAVTRDGSLSAHFEHTVAITDKGAEVLTI